MNPAPTAFFGIRRDAHRGGPIVTVYFDEKGANRSKCPVCGTIVTYREGYEGATAVCEGESFTEWTDQIGEFQLVVSECVVSDLREAEMTGFVAHPLAITRVESPKLRALAIPKYYVIEVTGRADMNRKHFDGGDGLLCEKCGVWRPRPGGEVKFGDKITIPLLETWDGSDFIMYQNIRYGGVYCTPRVVELARIKRWTGIRFRTLAPRLPPVNLEDPDWILKTEQATRDKYPELFQQ